MSDNKPPMTVWIDTHSDTVGVWSDTAVKDPDDIPYVNMGQFLEEVERRAKIICNASRKGDWVCDSMVNHHLYTSDAMQELAKEIMEGKS